MPEDDKPDSRPAEPDTLIDEESLAPSTARVYSAGWRDFRAWSSENGIDPLPARPEHVAEFLEDRENLSRSTLRNRISAIRHVHRMSGRDDPTSSDVVEKAWRRASNARRTASSDEKAHPDGLVQEWPPSQMLRDGLRLLPQYFETTASSPITGGMRVRGEEVTSVGELRDAKWEVWSDPLIDRTTPEAEQLTEEKRAIIPPLEYDLVSIRDRAMLLLIASGGARRSEVVGVDIHDVFAVPHNDADTLLVGLRKGNGMPKRVLEIPQIDDDEYCTARAVAAWVLVSSPKNGPLFRSFNAHESLKQTRISPSTINLVIERRVEQSGLDDSGNWSPETLRK